MAADSPTTLATSADLTEGAFADLARNFTPQAIADVLAEATRACETETGRRLTQFTQTETHRAEGVDPDELAATGTGLQLDLMGALGASYANSLGYGIGQMVRKLWVREFPPHFPELWTYSAPTISIRDSYGGLQSSNVRVLTGPTPDTGMLWFAVGTFMPIGSMVSVTYSGGYTTIPADLRRACKYMAAAILCRELDPERAGPHDPGSLEALAVSWLVPYVRNSV